MKPVIVIVPCYNEVARLDADAFEKAIHASDALRLHFVDDGSTDGTAVKLEAIANRLDAGRCSVMKLETNVGKAEAVRRGMMSVLDRDSGYADAFAVGFWDADLSTPLDDVGRFAGVLEQRSEALAVIGSRVRLMGRRVERKAVRHYAGRVFATLASWTLGFPVYDTQCGAKLFRVTDELSDLFAYPFITRWAFDVELLARFSAMYGQDLGSNRTVVEYPLERWTDIAGSKVKLTHLPRMIADLERIRRMRQ